MHQERPGEARRDQEGLGGTRRHQEEQTGQTERDMQDRLSRELFKSSSANTALQ